MEAVDDSAALKPPKKKKTPHSDTKTALAQTTIDNDNKKTPTSDNFIQKAAPLPPKPPCKCMCPLEQSASETSKPEWTTEVVDDSRLEAAEEEEDATLGHQGRASTDENRQRRHLALV